MHQIEGLLFVIFAERGCGTGRAVGSTATSRTGSTTRSTCQAWDGEAVRLEAPSAELSAASCKPMRPC